MLGLGPRRSARFLLALAAGVAFPGPRASAWALDVCKTCAGSGLAPCRACAKQRCTGERAPELCSLARCKACGGVQLAPCKCAAPPKLDLDARRAALDAWRVGFPDEVAQAVGREVAVAQSAHFVLVWDVPKVDHARGTTLHGALHLYLDRLEDFHARFAADVGAEERDFSSRTTAMVWARESDQEKAALQWTRQASSTESKLMGRAPVFSIFYDKGHLHEEYELHQAMVHQASHCLLSNAFDGIWPGNVKGGWVDEGLAHWYENALFDGVRHYCYVEADTLVDFKFGKWEASVRRALDAGEMPSVFALTALNTTEMTPPQRMFAWSLVDYLLRGPSKSLGAFAKAAKQKQPFGEACPAILGKSAIEFEREWHAWLARNYALKSKTR